MSPELIQAFTALTTGIYVLTVCEGEQRHGMSSSWVTQASGHPPLLLAAVNRRHVTHDIVVRTGEFVLNIIGERGKALEDYFYSAASRRPQNLDAVSWEESPRRLPLLRDAMANLECKVDARQPAGDHTLFVAAVTHVVWRGADRPVTSQDLAYVYVGEVVERAFSLCKPGDRAI